VVEAQLQEIINKIDHLIGLSNDIEQLLITRYELRLTETPPANSGEAIVASEVAAGATAEPAAASEVATP
jgi:hypothetical protein